MLFPYFRENIGLLKTMQHLPEVKTAFAQTIDLALDLDQEKIASADEIIAKLLKWSLEDRKITPLKALQGLLWKTAYENGSIKGHIYEDVPKMLEYWKNEGKQLAVFSSGSVAAQKLIFGYSEKGDLTPYFSAYFDTNTGAKKERGTYPKIAAALGAEPAHILFLSDVVAELQAADEAGLQTVQLVRPGTKAEWTRVCKSFEELGDV